MSDILVVGSGPAGLQASADLADFGHRVFLIEKEEEVGGNLRSLVEVSPALQKAEVILSAYLAKIEKSKNISVMKKAEIQDFSGSFPKFRVVVATSSGKKNLAVNAVVLATGLQPYNPSALKGYRYGKSQDVVTTVELERMLKERRVLRPSSKKTPKSVAFIQCAGSRDRNLNAYCSDFCCNNTIKLAQLVKKDHQEIVVSVFYMDMRTPHEGEIEFRNARRAGIRFHRGRPAKIREEDGALTITVEDTLENDLVFVRADLVVLSVGGVPDPTAKTISQATKINLSESGFFVVDDTTVGTRMKGIFVAGAASGPKDTAYSIAQGSCAAARINALLKIRGR